MITNIPILREILRSSGKARKSASRETLFSIGFSTLPIWLLPVMFGLLTQEQVFPLLKKVISTGELYLISAAMIGPMIYWILADYLIVSDKSSDDSLPDDDWISEEPSEEERFLVQLQQKFPDAIPLVSLLIVIAIISVFAVFLEHSDEVQPWAFKVDDVALMVCGIIVFIISVFLFYSVLCFKYDLQNAPSIMRDNTHDFVESFNKFKGSR